MGDKRLTINNIQKIEGKILLITTPMATNHITSISGLTIRYEIHKVEIGDNSYDIRLDDHTTTHIVLYRSRPENRDTYLLYLHIYGNAYTTLLNPDFLKTPELFISGLENTTWDNLPF